jgi:transcription termination/antitermination protein NusA
LVAKLSEAGVTTVEALADMTPEQLEAIPGIGPKTIEKITIAVTNYFGSLEAAAAAEGEAAATEGETAAAEVEALPATEGEAVAATEGEVETAVTAAPTEQPASDTGSEYQEAVNTGQALEAAEIAGVESAPPADVAEVHTHADNPETQPEDTVEPEEKPDNS